MRSRERERERDWHRERERERERLADVEGGVSVHLSARKFYRLGQ